MKLIQIFLPLYDNSGRRFARVCTPPSAMRSWSVWWRHGLYAFASERFVEGRRKDHMTWLSSK